jgi:hypothetical protein
MPPLHKNETEIVNICHENCSSNHHRRTAAGNSYRKGAGSGNHMEHSSAGNAEACDKIMDTVNDDAVIPDSSLRVGGSESIPSFKQHTKNHSVHFAPSTTHDDMHYRGSSDEPWNRSWLSWLSCKFRNKYCATFISSRRQAQQQRRGFFRCSETTASGWNMAKLWVSMMTFTGLIAWFASRQVSATLASILVLPGIAISQGSWAILRYRMQFGDSPLPKAPSHGIVKCVSKRQLRRLNEASGTDPPRLKEKGYDSAAPNPGIHDSSGRWLGGTATSFQGVVDPEHHIHPSTSDDQPLSSPSNHSTTSAATSPLRLLVFGDSLAIGVGQSKTATPIMPETIAKSLSKAMNGRPVLWTCHGAPGASAGWIVRELERSIQHGQFLQAYPPHDGVGAGSRNRGASSDEPSSVRQVTFTECDSFASFEDASSSSDEANAGDAATASIDHNVDEDVAELKLWSDRLKSHRIRFDPHKLGPFDIAVVLTGSNDLKSAFFPFLLRGEDAEFRRQAQLRGGGYGSELSRVLQVLNQRMRTRLRTMRQSVEAATEKVKESVDVIRERLGSHDLNASFPKEKGTSRRTLDWSMQDESHGQHKETSSLLQADSMLDDSNFPASGFQDNPRFPMVVLPGMPARALPIFQSAPLRWLAVPVVDIMDSHKRKLARQHDGDVIFVEAPSCEAIAGYSCQSGVHFEDEMDDCVLLNLRGIKTGQAHTIESDMAEYYKTKPRPPRPEGLSSRQRHQVMFSVDQIHPNDEGYRFWGRYIARAIVEEWKQGQTEKENGSSLV